MMPDTSVWVCVSNARVGQVVIHKLHHYKGVVCGWDEECRGADGWVEWVSTPCTPLRTLWQD